MGARLEHCSIDSLREIVKALVLEFTSTLFWQELQEKYEHTLRFVRANVCNEIHEPFSSRSDPVHYRSRVEADYPPMALYRVL